MMDYRHAYEPHLRLKALGVCTLLIAVAVVILDSIL